MSEAQATEARTLAALVEACDEMAYALGGIDTGDFYTGMTCGEVDSVASVLRLSGHADTAEFIIAQHAEGDDEGDEHYVEYTGPVCGATSAQGTHCVLPDGHDQFMHDYQPKES